MKYEMVPTPKGNSIAVKDFDINSRYIKISVEKFGKTDYTIIKFGTFVRTCCFKGIINFENELEVITEVLKHDKSYLDMILSAATHAAYKEGYEVSKRNTQTVLRSLLGESK